MDFVRILPTGAQRNIVGTQFQVIKVGLL